MDFSFLDKEEYNEFELFDDTGMSLTPEDKFFIRKYTLGEKVTKPHRHKYIQINYVNKGRGIHTVNKRDFDISKGDIFIIPPYIPHRIKETENEELEIIEFEFSTEFIVPSNDASTYLDFAYLEPFMVIEEQMKPCFKLTGMLAEEVEKIFQEVLEEYSLKEEGFSLMARALLLKLLVLVGRAYKGAIKGTTAEKVLNKFKTVIYKSKEYIDENFDDNITLNEVASKVNYSKSHFSYLFKAVMGKTFVEYLNEVRVAKAIELIETTDKNITDISYEVGFNSIANFNKNFKAVTGLTPSRYRR